MNRIIISIALALSLTCNVALASGESLNQGPKGSSMKLVLFTPLMMDAPFQIQYPEKWYAREEYAGKGNAGIFLTQEEITKPADKYIVGISVVMLAEKFTKVSNLSYEEKMGLVIQDIQKGAKILKGENISINGKNGIKSYIESDAQKGIVLAFILGNHLCLIQLTAPIAQYETYKKDFESVIDSFTWKPSKKVDGQRIDQKDPIIDAIAGNKKYTAIYNGEEIESVGVRDLINEKFLKEKTSNK